MIRSNKGMIVIKGSREYVFADFAVVVHSLKGALVESGMSSDGPMSRFSTRGNRH